VASFGRKNKQAYFPFSSLRILPYQVLSGAFNMALDFYLAQSIRPDHAPVLRFYGWRPYCLSLGYHQDASLVDLKSLAAQGYEAVRRPTGGSAIFHSHELTYALIVPGTKINHHAIYRTFHSLLAHALNRLGFPVTLNEQADDENYLKKGKERFACFNRPATAEIQFNGKKVVGSAQKLYRSALLQHGSILIGPEQKKIIRFLNTNDREKEIYLQKLERRSTALAEIRKIPVQPVQIAEALLESFEKFLGLNLYYEPLSNSQLTEAQKFVDQFKIQ